jgi:hypothetical protein
MRKEKEEEQQDAPEPKKREESASGVSWSSRKIWSWLSIRTQLVTVAALIAVPVTVFIGQFSAADVARFLDRKISDWPYWLFDWTGNAILISILLLVLFGRSRKVPTSDASAGESQKYRLLDDAALSGEQKDELGFGKFVDRLARTVVLPVGATSLVVGLEAPWGSGKSSALDLLHRMLRRHPDRPIVIKFNPWLTSGSDGLSRAFFSQFSGSLRAAGEQRLAESLVAYGELLEELMPPAARILPNIPKLRRIAGRIPEKDIDGEREQIAELVQSINRPVVVVIDDIDRLKPEDVVAIFHLVKAVASFPRVAYVLAFDSRPIDAALKLGGMYEDGREFRDKIVQANIPLPRVRYAARKEFLTTRLNQRFDAWKFKIQAAERRLLEDAIPLVLTVLRTPRDIKRVLNKTLLSAEGVREEVNVADVLVFETTHSIFPKVVDLIRQRPEIVDAGDDEYLVSFDTSIESIVAEEVDTQKRERGEKLRQFTELYPGRESELRPLLQFLFPSIADPYVKDQPAIDLRLSNTANLRKLLFQELAGELSAAAANAFLTNAKDRRPRLAEVVETNSMAAWLAHVRDYVSGVESQEPGELLAAVGEFVNDQFIQSGTDSSEDAGFLASDILDAIPSIEERWQILQDIVANPRLLAISERVLTRFLSDIGLWRDGTYLGKDQLSKDAPRKYRWLDIARLDSLRQTWLETVRSIGVEGLLSQFPNAGRILFRWKQWTDSPNDVKQLLERALADPENAARFINLYSTGSRIAGLRDMLTSVAWEFVKATTDHKKVHPPTGKRMRDYLYSNHDDESDLS